MKPSPFRCGVVVLLLLAGCDHDCFEIEVRPAGQAFQRKLTCWHVGDNDAELSSLSAEKLQRLGRLYSTRVTPPATVKQVFSGQFTDRPPADVGGAGSYRHLSSPLGGTSWYVERFRGNDDLESRLAKRRQAADKSTDLLVGWLGAELGHDHNFPALKKFLAEDFRRDLTNLGLYQFAGDVTSECEKGSDNEFLVRAGLYLCERGYFSPKDIPILVRAPTTDDWQPVLQRVQRLLARKMGIADNQPPPASLAFLDDLPKLKASLEKYIRSTDAFQKRLAKWKSSRPDKRGDEEPTPHDMITEVLLDSVGLNLAGGTDDSLELKLFCQQKPYATNGKWDEKATAATWATSIATDRALPTVCFALWSNPDRAAQQEHFGKIVLSDANLAQYAVWHHALKPDETRQWEEFVGGLKPGPGLKAAVEAFRFSADPKPNPKKPKEHVASLADTPRGLILQGLEAK